MKKNLIITVLAILLFLAVVYIVLIFNLSGTFCGVQVETDKYSLIANREQVEGEGLDPESEESSGARDHVSQNSQNDLKENIIGSWRDAQNEQSITSFEASGTFRFVYSGGAIQETGTYQIFADASVVPEELPNISGPVLRQSVGGNHTYYEILEITKDNMMLVDLNDGRTYEFEKVN
ncbi:MAG: hypothetical protein U5L75_01690 [Candidatus Campbellbacteria bacterium]|nr:hypothetical protein [Candidatus Campbellbacteria bacterium]